MLPGSMPQAPVTFAPAASLRKSSRVGWVLAFLFFPYGPFVYLAWLRVVSVMLTFFFLVVSAIVHIGLVSVLAKTNHEAWQGWVNLLLAGALYCLGLLQYIVGERRGIWSRRGQILWRRFGWGLGLFLLAGLLAMIGVFHLKH
jgi:hypothetical protein